MAETLDELVTEVEEANTVADSAIALLDNLKARLDAAPNMAAVRAISASIGAQKQEIADAILRNTPQDPTPTP